MPKEKSPAEKLADFIEKNPKCEFHIDNDGWYITTPESRKNEEDDRAADSDDYDWSTEWYSHSSNYGAGLAEALVILLNRRGFKIEAHAV